MLLEGEILFGLSCFLEVQVEQTMSRGGMSLRIS